MAVVDVVVFVVGVAANATATAAARKPDHKIHLGRPLARSPARRRSSAAFMATSDITIWLIELPVRLARARAPSGNATRGRAGARSLAAANMSAPRPMRRPINQVERASGRLSGVARLAVDRKWPSTSHQLGGCRQTAWVIRATTILPLSVAIGLREWRASGATDLGGTSRGINFDERS